MSHAPKSSKSEPIGLTIYDLPSPIDVAMQDEARTKSGRIRMLLVFAICAAPVFFSYLTYYVIRPQGTASFGQLIEPQRDLPALVAKDLNGQDVPLQGLRGQWLLIAFTAQACEPACEKLLYIQRQLHKSLGKQQDKLERVWLISDATPVDAPMLQALQGATVLRVDPNALSQWLYPASGSQLSDHLYLVDPMGRWMMRFAGQLDTEDAPKIKRDLERLLRAANSWDQPGR